MGFWLGNKNSTDIPSMLTVHQNNRAFAGDTITLLNGRMLGFSNVGGSTIQVNAIVDFKAPSTKDYNVTVNNIKYAYNGSFVTASSNVTVTTHSGSQLVGIQIPALSTSRPASLSSVVCEIPQITLTLT